MNTLRRIVESPWMSLTVGLVLLVTSGAEVWEALAHEGEGVGAHHGVFAFSLVSILRALPEAAEGLGKLAARAG